MPLESCMILLDNSEYMRNGDYIPSRLEAQSDAANLLVNAKTQSNPESTVGVIAMCTAGPMTGAQLLVSPTDDLGKILSALHGVKLCGEFLGDGGKGKKDAVDIAASVQVAALALKHRRNKNGSQRIVLFVGSPLNHADKRAFVKVGKQLKKNNVFIDVIALGELEENEPKLKELVDAANGGAAATAGGREQDGEGGGGYGDNHGAERTCHLVTIPAGVLPSDVLVTSPILRMDGGGGGGIMRGGDGIGAGGGGGAGGGFAEYGGVDPSMDPELAMALRVSMEEERARQERVAAAAAAAAARNGVDEMSSAEARGGDEAMDMITATLGESGELNDEDGLLQQALAMSMAENQVSDLGIAKDNAAADATMDTMDDGGDGEDDEDEAMQMALAMSMQGEEGGSGLQQQFQDPEFVNQV